MINKDEGGTIFRFYGGEHSCYEGRHRAHRGSSQSPTRENPDICLCRPRFCGKFRFGTAGSYLKIQLLDHKTFVVAYTIQFGKVAAMRCCALSFRGIETYDFLK